MFISNGSVTFGRTVKPADYEGKKVEVTLAFAIAEGEDAENAIASVSVIAHDRAMVMLMMPDKAIGALPMPAPAETAAQPTGNVREPAKRTRRNLSEVVIGAAAIGGEPSSTSIAPPSPPAIPPNGDPADIGTASEGPTGGGSASSTSSPAASPPASSPASADPATVDDWDAPAKPVTQEDLVLACKAANGRLGNPVPIRALIAEYAGPPPAQAKDVPEAKRAEFIVKINALQPPQKAAA